MVNGKTLLMACGVWASFLGLLSAAESAWMTDYASASARAEKLNRPLLVHFYGSNCPPCRVMERTILHQPEVERLLQNEIVGVLVNAGNPQDFNGLQTAQRFSVSVLPTDVIIHATSGKTLARTDGSQGYDDYLRKTKAAIRQYQLDRETELAAADAEKQRKFRQNPQPLPGESGGVVLGGDAPIVGLQGYSPVSLMMSTEWVRGKPEYAYEYKGIVYHMATRLEYDSFRARPEDFAPKYLGCDPVVLSLTDQQVAGRIEFGAFYEGELFLFTTAENRSRFKSSPLRYLRLQHVMKANDIDRSTLIR